jgi:hypothetical protein
MTTKKYRIYENDKLKIRRNTLKGALRWVDRNDKDDKDDYYTIKLPNGEWYEWPKGGSEIVDMDAGKYTIWSIQGSTNTKIKTRETLKGAIRWVERHKNVEAAFAIKLPDGTWYAGWPDTKLKQQFSEEINANQLPKTDLGDARFNVGDSVCFAVVELIDIPATGGKEELIINYYGVIVGQMRTSSDCFWLVNSPMIGVGAALSGIYPAVFIIPDHDLIGFDNYSTANNLELDHVLAEYNEQGEIIGAQKGQLIDGKWVPDSDDK